MKCCFINSIDKSYFRNYLSDEIKKNNATRYSISRLRRTQNAQTSRYNIASRTNEDITSQ